MSNLSVKLSVDYITKIIPNKLYLTDFHTQFRESHSQPLKIREVHKICIV